MSQINVNTIRNRTGGPPNLDKGAVVTGIVTATSGQFAGDVTVGGTLTYEDVTNIDSTGIVTAKSGIKVGNPVSPGIGATIDPNGNAVFAGIVTAAQFSGIDTDKISEGNTEVEAIDTGSDGHVKMTTEGSERLRVGPAGQIGLSGANYGTAGQLLTSSGNASAASWTTVSSAPEVSGTANGAIAAGKAVIANADGSIGQVKYSYTELGSYQNSATDATITGYDMYWTKVGYDSTNNQFLYFYKSTQQSNDGKINIGTPTGATTGSNVTIVQSNQAQVTTWIDEPTAIAWSKTSALGVALYRNGNGVNVRGFTSDGTTLTMGTELEIAAHDGGTASKYDTISWDVSSDKFLVVVGKNATNSNYAEAYVVSHSGTTLSKGSAVTVKTTPAKGADLAYDSDNNRHLLTYLHEQDSDKLCGRIITVSGTVPTVNAETKETATGANTRAVYIGGGKFVSVYGTGSAGYGRVVTISGTTVTFGTQSSAIPSGISGTSREQNQLDAVYDPGLEKVMVAYIDTSNRSSYCVLTPDTSANTISNVGSQGFVRGGNQSIDISLVYADHWQMNGFAARRGTGGQNAVYWTLTTTTRTTNITGENYLGVANASYTNGQTASIRVSGATQDSQTGLTPGQNYFVQNDGTLGTTAATPKVYAGTAVSSTKLLVGKESDSPSASWLKLASFDGSTTGSGTQVIYEDFANQTYRRYKLVYYFRDNSSGLDVGLQIKGSSGSWQTSSYRLIEVNFRDNDERTGISNENKLRLTKENVRIIDGECSFYDPADLNNNSPTEHMFGFTNYAQFTSQPGSNADCYQYNIQNGGWQGDGNQYVAGIRWNYGSALDTFSWALFAANGWN